MNRIATILAMVLLLQSWSTIVRGQELEHGYADSSGVKIHYVTAGEGPLVILLHGFPDFWYSWRDQIPALAKSHQVVAIDQRGYNKSDQPEGVENYAMPKLVGDVVAVMDHLGKDNATIVGHDWGGAVAWGVAMFQPQRVERLVILNLPHPNGISRELAINPTQQQNSQYARDFQKPDAAKNLTAENLAAWVKEPDDRARYVEAFRRSSFEGMLNYYKANYPKPSDDSDNTQPPSGPAMPKVKCPVLIFHGLDDPYLLAAGLNNTWEWLDNEMTLITIPGAGHFVHRDASDLVTKRMVQWLEN